MRIQCLALAILAHLSLDAQTIYQKKDDFSGVIHYYTLPPVGEQVKLEGGSFWSGRYVTFTFHTFKPIQDQRMPYVLSVRTSTDGWVFIKDGASLLMKLDDKDIVSLRGEGSLKHRKVQYGEHVEEVADYSLSLDQLRRLASARSISFRIVGDNQVITGVWKPSLLADSAYFAKEAPAMISDPDSAPAPSGGGEK